MAQRYADPELFRGYAAHLPWADIARRQGQHRTDLDELLSAVEARSQTRLVWMCAPALGVPRAAFTVWQRKGERADTAVDLHSGGVFAGSQILVIDHLRLASRIEVTVAPQDPSLPVHLYALRPRKVDGGYEPYSPAAVVASAWAPPGANSVHLGVTCGGAVALTVVNGSVTSAAVRWLDEDVDSDSWQPVEIVGMPVKNEIAAYVTDPQGMVDDLTDAVTAAAQRLARGLPLVGWPQLTETFHAAPPWVARDPADLIKTLRKELMPKLDALYATSPDQQGALREQHSAPAPNGDDGTARVSPFAALAIPAGTDPGFNLATGFGTAYAFGGEERPSPLLDGLQFAEFMVTAPYDVRPQDWGPGEVATIIGRPASHAALPYPDDLRADQGALIPPGLRDNAFRESVRVSWLPRQATAAMLAPGQAAFCTFPPGPGGTEPLMTETPSGTFEALVLARRPLDPKVTDSARLNLVHRDVELPFEGPTGRGYAVCVGDVFGLWSAWQDCGYAASAPDLEPPRIVSVGLTTEYAGTTSCPSELAVEVSVDWTERTPQRIELVAQYWPMATAKTDPPTALDPSVSPPPPMLARSITLQFVGDVPSTVSASTSVTALDEKGKPTDVPGPVTQGNEGRRYRVTYTGTPLDFSSVGRWGVRIWARTIAAIPQLPTPSAYSPRPAQPATAVAASPVPVVLPPPPPLPGVPMGSSPDAQGLSHVRLVWPPHPTPPVQRVVVWETSESVVLSRLPAPSEPNYAAVPGARLVTLRAAYDSLSSTTQQQLFRRVGEFDPAPGALDLTLPKGSRDIHFFVVTAVTTTGVESPWPVATGGGAAHEHLQAFMAPRMLRPAPPVARSVVNKMTGDLELTMEAASRIPVEWFEVFATRSQVAALDVMTMGPPHARIPLTLPDPPLLPTDPISGDPVYAETWTGGLAPAWEPWWVRVLAVPRPVIDEEATRGGYSLPSDLLRVVTPPPGPPDLSPLLVTSLGDGLRFRIDTTTSALERRVSAGEFTVSVQADAAAGGAAPAASGSLASTPLRDLEIAADVTGALSLVPQVRRQPRAAGETPLRVWLSRDDPAQALAVTVTVTDPLGRAVTQATTIAAGAGVPPPTLAWMDVISITGRGLVATLTSTVPVDDPNWSLTVTASKRGFDPVRPPIGPVVPPVFPVLPPPGRVRLPHDLVGGRLRRRLDDLIDLGPTRTLSDTWQVPEIPVADERPPTAGAIVIRRLPEEGLEGMHSFELHIPLAGATSLAAELNGPEGTSVSARWRAP